MPRISPKVGSLISNADLTRDEVGELNNELKTGQATKTDVATLTKRYGDIFGAGTGSALVSLGQQEGINLTIQQPIRSLGDNPASAAVLSGDKQLSATTHANDPAVYSFQRALNALGMRTGHPEYALLKSGADGQYGGETVKAVTAFQQAQGLPTTGAIDRDTAHAIEDQLYAHPPPDVGGVTATNGLPDGDRIAQAAVDLVNQRGPDYGTAAQWRSPNPDVQGNKNPGVTQLGAKDRWKCNLFGLDAMYLGGAKPPMNGGWYPVAWEIPNHTTGNDPPLIKLGSVTPSQLTPEQTQKQIGELLKMARPGDLLMVRHQAKDAADGGHTRVVVKNNYATDGTVDCAQAGTDSAVVKPEGIDNLSSDYAVFLLRPNQSREGVIPTA